MKRVKNEVDPFRPYAFLVEPELNSVGVVEEIATLFLTNRECPFGCTMCDLWKNTLDEIVPAGAIPGQIDWALARLEPADSIKLYNSGNWFDARAIRKEEWNSIAARLESFRTVIVENHPRLCGPACLEFADLIEGQLEIALGLETVNEPVLKSLNKKMTLDDFSNAVEFLHTNEIRTRCFIILNPPGTADEEAIEWAIKSVEFAFSRGVNCCCVLPSRNEFHPEKSPPTLGDLEAVFDQGLSVAQKFNQPHPLAVEQKRLFIDTWDAEQISTCDQCKTQRIERLNAMNLSQQLLDRVVCDKCVSC